MHPTQTAKQYEHIRSLAPSFYDFMRQAAQRAHNEVEVGRAAAQLWGLTEEELADIQASLRELKG